jgi:hypothetical protein
MSGVKDESGIVDCGVPLIVYSPGLHQISGDSLLLVLHCRGLLQTVQVHVHLSAARCRDDNVAQGTCVKPLVRGTICAISLPSLSGDLIHLDEP